MSLWQVTKVFLGASVIIFNSIFSASAEDKFYVYNLTTSKIFIGVYISPAGSTKWGANQALNDKDKSLDPSERLLIKGIFHGKFDLKLVDKKNITCVELNIDLSKEKTFEIRDANLIDCTP